MHLFKTRRTWRRNSDSFYQWIW